MYILVLRFARYGIERTTGVWIFIINTHVTFTAAKLLSGLKNTCNHFVMRESMCIVGYFGDTIKELFYFSQPLCYEGVSVCIVGYFGHKCKKLFPTMSCLTDAEITKQ